MRAEPVTTLDVSRPADPADYPAVRQAVSDLSAVQAFPHGTVFVFDHDLRYTHVGGDVLTSLGIDRTAYVGRTLSEMFDQQAVAVREPAYRLALTGQNVVLDAPLGDDRILEMHLSPLFDATGAVTAVMGFSLDVTELRRDTQSLRDAQEQFRVAFEQAPIGIALARLDGTLYRVNDALRSILRCQDRDLLGLSLRDLVPEPDRATPPASIVALFTGGAEAFDEEIRFRRPGDGTVLWVRIVCTLVRHASTHKPSHLIVQVSDITRDREQREQIEAAHAFQQAVLAASPDIIHVRDVGATTLRWSSKSLASVLGYTDEDLTRLGPALYDRLIPASDRARIDAASIAAQGADDGQVVQIRHRALHADGRYVWLSRRLTPFRRDPDGTVTQVLGLSRDVTDAVALEARLQHASLHDDLTGLPNRRLLRDQLREALNADPDGTRTAVLFCDLDSFKAVNDRHGHEVGDEVLRQVAVRLRSVVRDSDTVGRLGGDEFIIVVRGAPGQDLPRATRLLTDRVRAAVTGPMNAGGARVAVGVSVGVALAGNDADPDSLLRRADQEMYAIKTQDNGDRRRSAP